MVRLQRETPAMYVRPKLVHRPLHTKALDLRSCVPSLSWLQATRGVRNGHTLVPLTLQEARTKAIVRSVRTDGEVLSEVRHLQNGCRDQRITQRLERILLLDTPMPVHCLTQQLIQRPRDRRELVDKTAVIPHEANEHAYLLHRAWWCKQLHRLQLGRLGLYTLAAHHVAKVHRRLLCEAALLQLTSEVSLLKTRKHSLQMYQVFIKSLRVDHHVVQIDQGILIPKVTQHLIHQTLEGCRSIAKTKRHRCKLVQSIRGNKSCLRCILVLHVHLPVATGKVHSREELASAKLVQGGINSWKRVDVLEGYLVESAVVHTEASGAVLLGN